MSSRDEEKATTSQVTMSRYCFHYQCKADKEMYDFNIKSAAEFRDKLLNELKELKLQISEGSEKLAKSEEKATALEAENTELKKKLSELPSLVELEESLEKERSSFEKEKKALISELEKLKSEKTEAVSDEEKETLRCEIDKLTSKLSAMATETMNEHIINGQLQVQIDMLQHAMQISPEPSSNSSDTSSCKAFIGNVSSPESTVSQDECAKRNLNSDFSNASAPSSPKHTSTACSSPSLTDPSPIIPDVNFSDFMNSEGHSDDEFESFPFDKPLPSHTDFLTPVVTPPVKAPLVIKISQTKPKSKPVPKRPSQPRQDTEQVPTKKSEVVSLSKIKPVSSDPDFLSPFVNRPVNFEKGTTSNAKAPAVTKVSQSKPVSQPKSQPRQKAEHKSPSKATDHAVSVVTDKNGRAKPEKPKWLNKEPIRNDASKSFKNESYPRMNKNNHAWNHRNDFAKRDVNFPMKIYSIPQLIKLSHDCLSCSSCGWNDFDDIHNNDWFGSYHMYNHTPKRRPRKNKKKSKSKRGPQSEVKPKQERKPNSKQVPPTEVKPAPKRQVPPRGVKPNPPGPRQIWVPKVR